MNDDYAPVSISPDDWNSVLALNNAFVADLSFLDANNLATLLHGAFYAQRIGNLDAFLLALDQDHLTYSSPNYLWFRARYPRFVYVDRVVVADDARGRGHARRLYADLAVRALAAGHDRIVCEVNSQPPNPKSDAFHTAGGFSEVGAAIIHGGAKTVRYLVLDLVSTRR